MEKLIFKVDTKMLRFLKNLVRKYFFHRDLTFRFDSVEKHKKCCHFKKINLMATKPTLPLHLRMTASSTMKLTKKRPLLLDTENI